MKLHDIAENKFSPTYAYHVTRQDPRKRGYLQASNVRTAVSKTHDKIMMKAIDQYANSVFFSLGWPRALEWSEFDGEVFVVKYKSSFLINNFDCLLLKSDYQDERYLHLEYFLPEPDRSEYLKFIPRFRKNNIIPTFDVHPKMKKWSKYAERPNVNQLATFVRDFLCVHGKSNIINYLRDVKYTYFEELLVPGKIPLKNAISIKSEIN